MMKRATRPRFSRRDLPRGDAGAGRGRLPVLAAACLACLAEAPALEFADRVSPRNAERPFRSHTGYIILHTTEAPAKGALAKLVNNGEAHYMVDLDGRVYRIVDRRRVAYHAGRSMWNGRENLDLYSVGVEVVGYHDRDITPAQYEALRQLLERLQALYRVPDARVLTHCMVAYGAPNRWVRHSHRGRKRCGMLFATDRVRRRLGLEAKPLYDPDVRAGRLVVGDRYLAAVVYGGRTTQAAPPPEAAPAPDQAAPPRFVETNHGRMTPVDLAGEQWDCPTTFYFPPDEDVKRGDELGADGMIGLPPGTRALVGYRCEGRITPKSFPFDLCGPAWSLPTTFYRFPDGSLRAGPEINEKAIPENTLLYCPL